MFYSSRQSKNILEQTSMLQFLIFKKKKRKNNNSVNISFFILFILHEDCNQIL